MPSVSFILSTYRGAERIHLLHREIKSQFQDYELIVFSPNYPGPKIKWIREHDESYGGVIGYNAAAHNAQGDIIILITDDIVITGDINQYVKSLLDYYNNNEHEKIYGGYPIEWGRNKVHSVDLDTSPVHNRDRSLPLFKFKNSTYDMKKPALSAMSTKILRERMDGFYYNPTFRHHYCDSWLGVWLYHNHIAVDFATKLECKYYIQETEWSYSVQDAYVHKFLTDNVKEGCSYAVNPKSDFEFIARRYKKYFPQEVIDKLESLSIDDDFIKI